MKLTKTDISSARDYVRRILVEQIKLNTAYDPMWRKSISLEDYCISQLDELIEMKNELESSVKFFGSKKPNNWCKALEEFVDVLHFSAGSYVLGLEQEDDKAIAIIQDRWIPFFEVEDIFLDERSTVKTMMVELANIVSLHGKEQERTKGCYVLDVFVCGCQLFEITPEQLLMAYLHKNRKNHVRANNGAFSGDVSLIKAAEIPTYQWLYENSYVSKTEEEFNQLLDEKYGVAA